MRKKAVKGEALGRPPYGYRVGPRRRLADRRRRGVRGALHLPAVPEGRPRHPAHRPPPQRGGAADPPRRPLEHGHRARSSCATAPTWGRTAASACGCPPATPPLISPEDFQRVQERLDQRRPKAAARQISPLPALRPGLLRLLRQQDDRRHPQASAGSAAATARCAPPITATTSANPARTAACATTTPGAPRRLKRRCAAACSTVTWTLRPWPASPTRAHPRGRASSCATRCAGLTGGWSSTWTPPPAAASTKRSCAPSAWRSPASSSPRRKCMAERQRRAHQQASEAERRAAQDGRPQPLPRDLGTAHLPGALRPPPRPPGAHRRARR